MLERKQTTWRDWILRCVTIGLVTGPLALVVFSLSAAAQTMPGAPGTVSPTPTLPVLQNGLPTPLPTLGGGAPTAGQAAVDQIGRVAESVGQVARDPSLAAEQKAQQITALATQFNQLVAQWQQQALPGAAAGPPLQPIATPTALAPAAFATPTPVVAAAPGASTMSAEQLRSQLAAVTQAMSAVSQDPSLAPDARVQQLNALSLQFNQLLRQLQQLGGG